MSKVVLSGIRATGKLHFGSLLGAVQHFVQHQGEDTTCLYFVADLHTLTTLEDPEALRSNLIEIVKDYLAAGLDPEESIIYAQSSVPEIPELMLYLSMLQPLGELERTPTFKDLVRRNPDRVTHGLVSYPVLMAADILGPQADIVPVGSDQVPNVEMARNLAERFNARYGETFVVPEMLEEMLKVPGLDGSKMGKSDADNAIGIDMSEEEIRERYKKRGITDTQKIRKANPGDPYNRCQSVYAVHEMVTPSEVQSRNIANQCLSGSIGCADCKAVLCDSIMGVLKPFQERRREFADKDDMVREILAEGGKKARSIIAPTVAEVADKMGIVKY